MPQPLKVPVSPPGQVTETDVSTFFAHDTLNACIGPSHCVGALTVFSVLEKPDSFLHLGKTGRIDRILGDHRQATPFD
jgi:hypothetical protein